jgi:hypothetical protein
MLIPCSYARWAHQIEDASLTGDLNHWLPAIRTNNYRIVQRLGDI